MYSSKEKNNLIIISIIQIIACIGVFNGHFLLNFCDSFCYSLRASAFKYSPLSFFFMGDLNVQLFFVLGGFLIPISSAGKQPFSIKQVILKWSTLIIPALILTAMVYAVYSVIGIAIGNSLPDDMPTSLSQFIDDSLIFLTGRVHLNPKEFEYTPYALSQLWFLIPFLKGWIVSYCVFHMCKSKGFFIFIPVIIAICILFSFDYSNMLIGMLFGEVYLRYRYDNKILAPCIAMAALCFCPVIFSSPLYERLYLRIAFYILFGISFWLFSCLKPKIIGEKTIRQLNKYYMGIYYVHQPILAVISYMYKNLLNTTLLPIVYFIVIALTICFAMICKKYIFENTKKITLLILDQI